MNINLSREDSGKLHAILEPYIPAGQNRLRFQIEITRGQSVDVPRGAADKIPEPVDFAGAVVRDKYGNIKRYTLRERVRIFLSRFQWR